MASASGASPSKSYEVTTVEATGLAPVRFKLGRTFITHVQIDAGNLSWTTPGVKWRKDGTIRWDDKIVIPPSAGSTKVTFSLFRDKTLIGQAEIDLSEALAKSNEGVILSLQRKDKETGKLTVKVAESSTTARSNVVARLEGVTANLAAPAPTAPAANIASVHEETGKLTVSAPEGSTTALNNAVDHLQGVTANLIAPAPTAAADIASVTEETGRLTVRASEGSTTALSNAVDRLEGFTAKLTAPRPAAAADIASATGDAAISLVQSDLVGSLTSLFSSLSVLVKVGDEIAKIHPWVGLAWNVLSVGLKLVEAQLARDDKITSLIQAIQSTYSVVVGSKNLKDQRLQDVLDRILKQTVDCGYFIQEYTRRRTFLGKAITETFSRTDDLVARYQNTFTQLQGEFTGRIATHTALMTAHVEATVDDIRFDQLLEKLRPANMDQSKRGICLPATQLDAITSILNWYSDDSDTRKSAMWLHGKSGTGKSTLSTTIARMMDCIDGVNLLGSFFFFDRDLPHWNASTLIRTIAYELAQFDGTIGAKIIQVIKDIPGIANHPLAVQFSKLLSVAALGDIPWTRGPVLVVIDGLDECGSVAERADLMRVLSEGVSKLPPFLRLLIVSRLESDISDHFDRSLIRREELTVDSKTNQADVTAFIRSRLKETSATNIDTSSEAKPDWPDEDEVEALAVLASGHFIWADTACRMIDTSRNPRKEAEDLIKDRPTDVSGGSLASLHQLYKTALQSSGQWDDPSFCSQFRDILGVVVCAQTPLSCSAIDSLLGPQLSSSEQRLPSIVVVSRFRSVLNWSDAGPVRVLHASFYDYVTSDGRREPWAIDVVECKVQLACGCIALLERELRENMCNLVLPLPVTDNQSLSEGITYACKTWVEHVCSITNGSSELAEVIYHFLQKHLLHWMEALAIMKARGVAIHSLSRLLQWTQKYFAKSGLYHFVHDAHRFAQYFSSTIERHPLLIYTSAVPFTPHDTLIYKKFHRNKMPHVVSGVDLTWPPLLQVLYGHGGVVRSVFFSPDGSKIASGSWDNTVRVWDAVTGLPAMPPLQGHKGAVTSVCFSPDGSRIASGSVDNTIRLWDAVTGQPAMPPLRGHTGALCFVCFSPGGSKIASGSEDGTLRVWDAATGRPAMPPLQGHEGSVTTVCFSPDESKIASGSADKTVRVWNAVTGQPAIPPLRAHEHKVLSICFSPDGSKITSGSDDQTIRVWDAVTGQPAMPPLRGHTGGVTSVCSSPDGSKIVSGSWDTTVQVWDAVTGQPAMPPLQGHKEAIWSVCFSPDGSKTASGSVDGTIRLWDVVTQPAPIPLPQGHQAEVKCTSFSQDGSKIASGSQDGTLGMWDAFNGQAVFPLIQGHAEAVNSLCFSPDGSKFATGSDDKTVRVWDAVTGQAALPPVPGHKEGIYIVVFLSDGSKIISGSNTAIQVWDTVTGKTAQLAVQGSRSNVSLVARSMHVYQIVSETEVDPGRTVSVGDAASKEALRGDTHGASIHRDRDDAQVMSRMDKDGYFIDTNSGRYIGKLPDTFAFSLPEPKFHKSSCFGWTKSSSGPYIPVIIHFPG